MQKKKIWWIIGLLFLLYCSASGNYLNSGDEYLYENSTWLAIIDLVICSVVMMIVPFIWRLVNKKRFSCQKGKKICKWNSIIIFIISIILSASNNISIVGGLGAIMYYFINKWLFVNEEVSDEQISIDNTESHYECNNCGHMIPNNMKHCPNCHWIQDEEENEEIDEEDNVETEELEEEISSYELAVELFQNRNYEEATLHFEKYIKDITKLKKQTEDEWFTFNNAIEFLMYAQNNETDKKVVDVNYRCNTAYYFLSMIDFEKGNYEEAIKKLNKALKWNPCDIKSMFEKAENYKASGDLKKYYTSTLDLFDNIYSIKDLARYYRNLGYYFIEEKNWDLAKAMYLYSVRFDNNPVALQELKYILSKSGNETLPAKEDLVDILKENRIDVFISKSNVQLVKNLYEKLKKDGESNSPVGKFVNEIYSSYNDFV